MSKVLVDRELLEKWTDKLEGADSAGYGWEDLLAAEIRGAIAQPVETEGVDFGFDDRSVKVSQEAYSIFLERERALQDVLSAVTAERDRLREAVELLSRLRGLINCTPENDVDKVPVWISTKHPTVERIDALLAAMAAKEA